MSNLLKSKFFLGVMIVTVMVVGFAFVANTASAECSLGSTTLKYGSTGTAVTCLQETLGLDSSYPTGYFGSVTLGLVKAFQSANGLDDDGAVGPLTKAALSVAPTTPTTTTTTTTTTDLCPNGNTLASNCSLAPTTATTTEALCPNGKTVASNCSVLPATTTTTVGANGLAGTFGTISTISQLSAYNNEEVGDGSTDVKVMGFDLDASADGDISLQSIKLTFDATGLASGDSSRITDFLSSVSVWMGTTKIGTVSTADFTKDDTGIYSKTISLSNAIVRADKTEKFYVSVDAIGNLDSGDINSDSWTVGINSIRYVDGSGVVTTDADIMPAALEWNSAGDGVGISFVTFSTSVDTELKLSLDSASPKAGISSVNATNNTDNVVIAKGKMKLEGTSNVWLDELPFLFTTDATNVDDVTATVYLNIGGNTYSESMTATAGTTEAITFDNLDLDLTAGSTTIFTVLADINDIEAGTFDEGKYMKVDLDATRRALIIAENTQGEQLTDGTEMTGVVSGNNQYFYSIAPMVEVSSISIIPVDNGSSAPVSATAKMTLKITADGGTIYLNGDDEVTAAKELITLAVDGGNASTSVSSYTFTPSGTYTVTNDSADNEYYTLNDNDTMYVLIEAVVTEAVGSAAVLAGMKGTAVLFGTDATSDTTRSANTMNWSTLTDILKTGKTVLDS